MTDLDRLKQALPLMTDEQLKRVAEAHNKDPYVGFESKRGEMIREEINKRSTRYMKNAIDAVVDEVLGGE